MPRSVLGIIGLVLLLQGFLTNAATITVPDDAATIQGAIDRAAEHDTVLVSPGTYRESIVFRGRDISLISREGALKTFITGPDDAILVTLKEGETSSTLIQGFTFKGGWIGLYCENSAATVRRNVFEDQKTTDWAAVALAGEGYPPSASYGPAAAIIDRNTILRSANGGISSFSTEPPVVSNNIIAFCKGYGVHFQGEFENIKLSHNDVFGNTANYINVFYAGVGSFSADPLVGPGGSLQGGSPCIDRGDTIDMYGDMVGSAWDIGALEYGGAVEPFPETVVIGPRSLSNVVASQTPTISWPHPIGEYGGYQIQVSSDLDWTTNLLWDTGARKNSDTSVTYAGTPLADGSAYYARVRISDGERWGSWRCAPLITRSYLRVGFEAIYPPFEFVDSTHAPIGLDVDIARGLATALQRGLKITIAEPDELLRQLKAGEIDAIGGMQFSEERDRFMDFSPPYASIRHTVFALKGTRKIDSIEDLRDVPLAVVNGGLMYEYVLEQGLTDNLTVVHDPAAGLRGLTEGDYTYLILGRIPGSYWIDSLGLKDVEIAGPIIATARLCLAVSEGNTDLQAELSEGLEMLRRTGQYQAIGERWLGPSELEQWTTWGVFKHVLYIIVPILVIVAAVGLWNWSLRRTVARRTTALNRELAERKRAQAALSESEAVARALLRAPTDAILLISTDMTVVDCNETAEKNLGLNREDIIGRSAEELLPPEVARERRTRAQLTLETGKPCRFEDKNNDRWLDHVFYPIFNSHGRVSSIASISRDITARKKMEDRIKESEARFRTLINSAQDAIFIKNRDLRYTFVNPAIEKQFSMPKDKILGSTTEEIFGPEAGARMREVDKRVLNGEVVNEQHSFVVNQVKHSYDVVIAPMRMPDGKIIGLCGIARDMTETIRLQQFNERAKRLEAAGRIAGQVAHDFNNLLGPLLAYPDLIREQIPEDSPVKALLDDIESSAEQMAEINQQLLTLGRRGHYIQDPVDLNKIVQAVLDRFEKTSARVSAHVVLDSAVFPLIGGESQIQRAVANLLTNAYEAIDDAGAVTVITSNCYLDKDYQGFEAIPAGEYVKLTVSDTGIGIDQDIMSRIFDPFFTTKRADRRRGSGLGLSVVQAVVKDHRGYIDIVSGPKGTEVSLYFPAARDAVPQPVEEELGPGHGNILVVDDDASQLRVIRTLLESLGYTVHTADNGEDGLRMARERQFDLVLLDMIMREGPDGAETFQRMREVRPDLKALIISGYAETERVKLALSLGASAFLRKPLTLKTIATAVKNALDLPSGE